MLYVLIKGISLEDNWTSSYLNGVFPLTKSNIMKRWCLLVLLVLLVFASPIAISMAVAEITNPGFEEGSWESDWTFAAEGQMSYNRASQGLNGGGIYHLQLFSIYQQTVYSGNYVTASQDINLTNVDTLKFDARLDGPFGWATDIAIAEVLIGDDVVWSSHLGGDYFNTSVPVTGYSGLHTLSLRNRVYLTKHVANVQIANFDNFRLEVAVSPGDVDGNGTVDLMDTIAALQVLAGMVPVNGAVAIADINNDGIIGLAEAISAIQTVSE